MVDLMGLSLDLMANTVVLLMQPFSLLKVVCMFGVRTFFLVTHIWLQLMRAIINFNVDVCWKIMVWTYTFVSLPMRIWTALQRERLLEMHLYEMQMELENLALGKKQLDERLQITMKDCRIMGSIISELEEDHDKALAKIELLESELQALKQENIRITKTRRNDKWNLKDQDHDSCDDEGIAYDKRDVFETEYDTPLLKTGRTGSKEIIHDLAHEGENMSNNFPCDFLKMGLENSGLLYPLSSGIITNDDALDQSREVAFSQSLFSAIFSLLVGMIIWEAEDTCMPLVIALFTVVGMSLRSVVKFFSTIKNRPASDAVALLSFNWFILGTLTYPTLPIVARVLVPQVLLIAYRIVPWFGACALFWKD